MGCTIHSVLYAVARFPPYEPFSVKVLALLHKIIVFLCRFLTCNFVLLEVAKHPTRRGRRFATTRLSTNCASDAREIAFNILAASFGHNLLIPLRLAIFLGDFEICLSL